MLAADDFISEAEVEGLLEELDLMRVELEGAVKYAESMAQRAEAAELRVAALEQELPAAKGRAVDAERRAAALQAQLREAAAEVEAAAAGGGDTGVGRRMRSLMQVGGPGWAPVGRGCGWLQAVHWGQCEGHGTPGSGGWVGFTRGREGRQA
jgi:hypothetical protein